MVALLNHAEAIRCKGSTNPDLSMQPEVARDYIKARDGIEFGMEVLDLDGRLLHGDGIAPKAETANVEYVNTGDTYDSTLCRNAEGVWFVSSWGDVVEESERQHADATNEHRCCNCGTWTPMTLQLLKDEYHCPDCVGK
jgi:hypothetical protein